MKRIDALARWKNNPVTLSSWSYMRPTFHLDSPRTSERDQDGQKGEIKRGKGGVWGGVCAFALPILPPLCFCFLFLCMLNAHTHGAMDFQLGPHQLCAWWNKHWQPLYICKGPCSSCACPTHKHTHLHTHTTFESQAQPQLGPTGRADSAQNGPGCALPCSSPIVACTRSQTNTPCVMFR